VATLNDNALTTIGAVEDVVTDFTSGGSEDDLVIRYINQVSSMVESALDRKLYRADGHVERTEGYDSPEIFVRDHVPIVTINSVVYDDYEEGGALDSDDYAIGDADTGEIRAVNGIFDSTGYPSTGIVRDVQPGTEQRFWKVDYDGGYVTPKQVDDGAYGTRTLPDDLEWAVLSMVRMMYAETGKNPAVSKISMDDGSITYGGTTDSGVTRDFAYALDQYRLPEAV